MTNFDNFWQNIDSIEFACFSFHVGLLVITLSSLKLYIENNACMFLLLTGSVTHDFGHFRCCNL